MVQEDYIQIKKGVKVGEKVVTYGQLGLAPGSKVQIVTDAGKKGSESSGEPKAESETK